MPYDPALVQPMRDELSQIGIRELLTSQDVDAYLSDQSGTALLIVNSVCGCAAGNARPGVRLALQHANKPDRVATVFAGQDVEATAQARAAFADYPPSSPSFALLKDGKVVHFVPRHKIESQDAQGVAQGLTAAFDQYCTG